MQESAVVLDQAVHGSVPAGWCVVHTRFRRFLVFIALVLATTLLVAYSVVSAVTTATDRLAHGGAGAPLQTLPHAVEALVFGAALLSAVTVATAGYIWTRRRVLVLLPDGFVYGETRRRRVRCCINYTEITHVRLRTVGSSRLALFSRLQLEFTNAGGHILTWTIEELLALPSTEVARLILTQWIAARSHVGPADARAGAGAGVDELGGSRVGAARRPLSGHEEEPPATQVAAWVASGWVSPAWRVVAPALPWSFWWRQLHYYVYLLPLISSFLISAGLAILLVFVLPLEGVGTRGHLVLPPWWLKPLLFVAVMGPVSMLGLAYLLWGKTYSRRRWLSDSLLILTPWALIQVQKRTGRVEREIAFGALTGLTLSRWLTSFTVRFRLGEPGRGKGSRETLRLYADLLRTIPPAQVVQDLVEYAARYHATRLARQDHAFPSTVGALGEHRGQTETHDAGQGAT